MWLWLKPLIYFLFCWYKNVLRGAAGERECVWDWEIERGEMEQFKVPFKHLSFPGISKVCECNVSLRTAQIDLLDCVCWQTAMSFFSLNSPAPRPSLQSTSLSPPLCHPSICLFLFVSHFFSVSTCLPIACPCVILAFYLWIVLISIFQIDNNNNNKKKTQIYVFYINYYIFYITFPQTPTFVAYTHTRHRQIVQLSDKHQILALTAATSTLSSWGVNPRITGQMPRPPIPPVTRPQHAATFPVPLLCSTPTTPPAPLSWPPKWEWPPLPPHLPPQGYTYNRR